MVLPKAWVVGRVDKLSATSPHAAPGVKVDLQVGEKKLSMDSELASKLRSGEKIAVKVSQIFDRVVEVRR